MNIKKTIDRSPFQCMNSDDPLLKKYSEEQF